jgi:hypothetical protein
MKTKKTITCALLGLVFACNAIGQEVISCLPIPQNPAVDSSFVLRANGTFGWDLRYFIDWDCMPGHICYQVESNHFTITIYYQEYGTVWEPVIVPWQQDITIYGLSDGRLPHGGYRATVIFAPRATGPTTTATTSFVVGTPRSLGLTTSESNLSLSWGSADTLRYSIQSTTQLTANAWTDVPEFSNVDGAPWYIGMYYQAPITNDPLRMYRLIYTPK